MLTLAILAAFLIVIHLGFASATGLAAAMIPIIISVLQGIKTPGINVLGMTMIPVSYTHLKDSFGIAVTRAHADPQGCLLYTSSQGSESGWEVFPLPLGPIAPAIPIACVASAVASNNCGE